jgi:hypothetical protein
MIVIEEGIPVPEGRVGRSQERRLTEELKAMKAGQSVLLDRLQALSVYCYFKRRGIGTVRKAENGKIRVWRTS